MNNNEKLLLLLLENCQDTNAQAILLQSFIADNGLLSEVAGERVRAILNKMPAGHQRDEPVSK